MLKNDQMYFKNCAVFTLQDFLSTFCYFSPLYMKELRESLGRCRWRYYIDFDILTDERLKDFCSGHLAYIERSSKKFIWRPRRHTDVWSTLCLRDQLLTRTITKDFLHHNLKPCLQFLQVKFHCHKLWAAMSRSRACTIEMMGAVNE